MMFEEYMRRELKDSSFKMWRRAIMRRELKRI